MRDLKPLHDLAAFLGVATHYIDGLCKPVDVGPDTIVRVCAALGAPVAKPADAPDALRAVQDLARQELVAPVVVAWDGVLPAVAVATAGRVHASLRLEDGESCPVQVNGNEVRVAPPLPPGYHAMTVEAEGRHETCHVIAAPVQAYRRPGAHRSWGVGTQLAALRSRRSRSVGDLRDLETLARWVLDRGGDLVTALPLLPTFNTTDPEPSPYSPVSRLFWSELVLDLGAKHRPVPPPARLDVQAADAEVRAALAGIPAPDPGSLDAELRSYARFRGAQARLGRNWREWPAPARGATLAAEHVDAEEERFHLVAQTMTRKQMHDLRARLEPAGMRLGLDLAVGVHPDGYDPWSRQAIFGDGMAVGAPPDGGFPSGQDWGFSPVLPAASRREGHRYIAASIGHQMQLAGVLRVDHIMAWTRLYWIPHGFGLHLGTYVKYPADELFALLTLESHRHRCEVVGENLGTVPPEIGEALPRHRIWGMYLAQFAASDPVVKPPTAAEQALVGTHDTPTWAEFLAVGDIAERVEHALLAEEAVPAVIEERTAATQRLAEALGGSVDDPRDLLDRLLDWLGRSESPLVVPWLEDLWLEGVRVNLPGTRSSQRPNWQRPMKLLLDDVFTDAGVAALLGRLHRARHPE
jgi:4-alpha-glucanotransferase